MGGVTSPARTQGRVSGDLLSAAVTQAPSGSAGHFRLLEKQPSVWTAWDSPSEPLMGPRGLAWMAVRPEPARGQQPPATAPAPSLPPMDSTLQPPPCPARTVPCTEIGKKHQGTSMMLSEKQHLRDAHSSGLMPGYPQSLRAETSMTHSSDSGHAAPGTGKGVTRRPG